MADTIYGTGSYTAGTAGNDVMKALVPSTLDGGRGSDNLNGSSGNDIIQGGAGNDFMYGGGGNDTFLWVASDVFKDNADNSVYDKVFDFAGAGVASGDRLTFQGFGVGSSLEVVGQQEVDGGAVIYNYLLTDTATGHSQHIYITSLNGNALTAGDYAFQGSVAVPPVA